MSSRKSDNLPDSPDSPAATPAAVDLRLTSAAPGGPAGPGAPIEPVIAPAARSGWLNSLSVNAPLPILLALLPLLGWYLEQSGFDRYYLRVIMLVGFNVVLAVGLQLINGFSGQFSLGHAGFMAVGAYLAAYPAKRFSHQLQDPAGVVVYYLALGLVIALGAATLGLIFSALRASRRGWAPLPALLLLLLGGWRVWGVAH